MISWLGSGAANSLQSKRIGSSGKSSTRECCGVTKNVIASAAMKLAQIDTAKNNRYLMAVFRHHFHAATLIFLLVFLGRLHVLDVCIFEHEILAQDTGGIPNAISCVDSDEESPFLCQTFFPKTAKRALDAYRLVSLQGVVPHGTVFNAFGAIIVPLAVPIYQSKTVYRI